jgi:hypothetical protein
VMMKQKDAIPADEQESYILTSTAVYALRQRSAFRPSPTPPPLFSFSPGPSSCQLISIAATYVKPNLPFAHHTLT